jgi:hypothetical protein
MLDAIFEHHEEDAVRPENWTSFHDVLYVQSHALTGAVSSRTCISEPQPDMSKVFQLRIV